MNKKRELLIEILVPIFAVLMALIFCDILILIYKESPYRVYKLLVEGTLLNPYGIGQVLFKTTPLIFSGLAVAFAFRSGLFNIGGEGQLYMGAFATAIAGMYMPSSVPFLIAVILCIFVGFMSGAVVGFIPGYLKARFGSHEVINTIMLNFIVLALINYLVVSYFKVPETLHTEEIVENARIMRLSAVMPFFKGSAVNLSFVIALVTCGIVYIILWKTKFGYELRAVGLNPSAAATAGINVKRTLISAMCISGGLAGMVGINYVMGYKYYFEEGFSSGLGFMGIAVALLGRNHPFGVILAAILFGILSQGGLVINAVVPKELVDILQAIVIICVVSSNSEVRRILSKSEK
ncbi:MAG: L-arabinose transporter permease protein [Elusimicrobia bacterium ADurb.Bin231]|nr:MAG: L-arabinose transporter permease protein [Elusimicrobia bacterium ADurb.Bin231]